MKGPIDTSNNRFNNNGIITNNNTGIISNADDVTIIKDNEEPVLLSDEQKAVLDLCLSRSSLFFRYLFFSQNQIFSGNTSIFGDTLPVIDNNNSGPAGTGKSFLLKQIIKEMRNLLGYDNVYVTGN